jgi:hypothetical protein
VRNEATTGGDPASRINKVGFEDFATAPPPLVHVLLFPTFHHFHLPPYFQQTLLSSRNFHRCTFSLFPTSFYKVTFLIISNLPLFHKLPFSPEASLSFTNFYFFQYLPSISQASVCSPQSYLIFHGLTFFLQASITLQGLFCNFSFQRQCSLHPCQNLPSLPDSISSTSLATSLSQSFHLFYKSSSFPKNTSTAATSFVPYHRSNFFHKLIIVPNFHLPQNLHLPKSSVFKNPPSSKNCHPVIIHHIMKLQTFLSAFIYTY